MDINMNLYFIGDLMKEEEVLDWLFYHVDNEEIADITDEMLDKLIISEPFLAVLFCKFKLLRCNKDIFLNGYINYR